MLNDFALTNFKYPFCCLFEPCARCVTEPTDGLRKPHNLAMVTFKTDDFLAVLGQFYPDNSVGILRKLSAGKLL